MEDKNKKITIEDILENEVDGPIEDDGDISKKMERGNKRVKDGLLTTAIDRPLTDEEAERLSMSMGFTPPTKEFAEFVLREGREA